MEVFIFEPVIKYLTQAITGRLLSEEQIKAVSQNVVGAYFRDWLPEAKQEIEASTQVDTARLHINEASRIISALHDDLEIQAKKLQITLEEIEEKKKVAERYSVLVEQDEKVFAAYRAEMEASVRKELLAISEHGKRKRQIVTFVIWLVTLILGAILGNTPLIYNHFFSSGK